MTTKTHVKDLLPAYALGSLDDEEMVQVSEHLSNCPECRAELAAWQAVVDGMLLSAPGAAPLPDSKRRLMNHIRRMPQAEGSATTSPQPWWQRLFLPVPARMAFALGSLALVLILVLLFNNVSLSHRLQQLQPPQAQSIVPNPNPYIVGLRGTDLMPEARGIILIGTDGHQAVLIVEGLQPLDNLAYQLWLNRYDQLASAGYFTVSDRGRKAIELTAPDSFFNYRGFEITIEPAGGSLAPTGERVMDGFLNLLEMLDLLEGRQPQGQRLQQP